jgi:ABC-type polysaccharide/polyol phosphate transport system ATPase subunit
MPKPIITVDNLSKSYLLGHESVQQERYTALRDVIAREVRSFVRKTADVMHGRQIVEGDEIEEFWALKNINFQVKEGEVLGIIGRNGAGKSTLLKVLSRIIEPSEGRIVLRGRIASLLEVGTGFHPELTGRENIFLNGAILGMRRADIKRKFDEIVAFAGVERFLDLPVKRYSSGMYVRLAFSVAAHLECDVLIVDEVLAVGDHEFQKKCLGKMHDVASKEGRTVLLVSHNLAAISEMANRVLLLDAGRVLIDGTVPEGISTYLSKGAATPIYVRSREKRCSIPHIRKMKVCTSNPNGVHLFGERLEVTVWIRHEKPMSRGCFSFQIVNQYQQPVIHAFIYHPEVVFGTVRGESILVCQFPSLRLNVGQFHLRGHLSEPPGGDSYETIDGVCLFEVVRPSDHVLWGWRPEVCVYHEQCTWTAVGAQSFDETLVD